MVTYWTAWQPRKNTNAKRRRGAQT